MEGEGNLRVWGHRTEHATEMEAVFRAHAITTHIPSPHSPPGTLPVPHSACSAGPSFSALTVMMDTHHATRMGRRGLKLRATAEAR